jgi:hypothetical protein
MGGIDCAAVSEITLKTKYVKVVRREFLESSVEYFVVHFLYMNEREVG